jgi:hypothetical protein
MFFFFFVRGEVAVCWCTRPTWNDSRSTIRAVSFYFCVGGMYPSSTGWPTWFSANSFFIILDSPFIRQTNERTAQKCIHAKNNLSRVCCIILLPGGYPLRPSYNAACRKCVCVALYSIFSPLFSLLLPPTASFYFFFFSMRLSSDYTTERIFSREIDSRRKISAVHRCSQPAAARTHAASAPKMVA